MSDTQGTIEEKLRQAWRQERRFLNVRGSSRFLIWLIAMIGLDFLIDWGLLSHSSLAGRVWFLLPLINIVVLAWVLWREWLRHLKPFNPLVVALDVETKHPELASLLVSYTQIKGPIADQPLVSAELIEAMRNEAITQTRRIDFREIVDFGQLKKLLGVAAAVILLFGILSVSWQEHLRTLFQRLAGVKASYPTQTEIVDVTGNLTVRLGDSVTILGSAGGVLPELGEVHTQTVETTTSPTGEKIEDLGPWKTLPLKKDNDSAPGPSDTVDFTRVLKDLQNDLNYHVEIGDDRSATYRITVVPSPQVVATRVKLTYPSYLRKDPEERTDLNLEVLEGTRLEWNLRCEPAVKRLEVRTDKESLEAKVDESGKNLTFSLVANTAFKYTFRWTERDSGKDFQYDDVQHTVRVTADDMPEVELLRPRNNGLGTVKKTLTLRARARDLLGLSKAWLVYSLEGSQEKREEIHDFAGVPAREFTHVWSPKKSIPELQPGMRVTFAVEVADLHPETEKHTRRSATRQLTIVTPERYLQWFREELAAQHDEITRAREAEKTSSTRVKELRVQEGEVR